MATTRKTEVSPINGTPVKRMFWSIISDYDLRTGLCELVDNAIDQWMMQGRSKPLEIKITLDVDRQLISVHDNAGGVKHADLHLLIAPGGSRNDPNAEVIGIFGVGGKRASIALGERVEIKTRFHKEPSFEVDVTQEWLESDDWELAAYSIPDIPPSTTAVEVSVLRKTFSQPNVEEIVLHLGETYAWFLRRGCSIAVNGGQVGPAEFDKWTYPKDFPPLSAAFDVDLGRDGKLKAEITAGLIWDRDPELDNYGVYIYCNHRLIVKEFRTREVGYFVTSEAGVPHPDASLCRAIVDLQGPAKLMPWNSSKSGFNVGHPTFQQIRPTLIRLVSHFSSLSRRLKHDWDQQVFTRRSGSIEKIEAEEITTNKRLSLPPLPRVNKPQVERLKTLNKKVIHNRPWTLGLVEGVAAVDIIARQRLETKNRIALILLDSNFEIALKEYIVHRTDLFPQREFTNTNIQQLFQRRPDVIDAVTTKTAIPANLLAKARHYYEMRNKLMHERATVDITDTDVENYQSTVQAILTILFGLRFGRG
jgi:hypothetical protein